MAFGADPFGTGPGDGKRDPSACVLTTLTPDGKHVVELSEVTRALEAARRDERAKVVARVSAWADANSGPGGDIALMALDAELLAIGTGES